MSLVATNHVVRRDQLGHSSRPTSWFVARNEYIRRDQLVAPSKALFCASPSELASQPLKMPVTLELLISTLASNKASPLGASLYNT